LKHKLVIVPILVFLDWQIYFHVHVDASSIALNIVLSELGEGELDHPISFDSRKLSTVEKNYMKTEREVLEMVYSLQKFMKYLSGSHFNMYMDYFALRYIVNNIVLGRGESTDGYCCFSSMI
jgi:hypothetical protein